MASAFTLFGEINLKTSNLKAELNKAEGMLKKTKRSLDQTEASTGRADTQFQRMSRTIRQDMGQALGRLGVVAAGAATALGVFGVKSALGIDKVRTTLTALTGSTEAANAKLAELNKLSAQSPGVTRAMGRELFAAFKVIDGVGDKTINGLIQSMGKLNAAFTIDDNFTFARNLQQIFTQGFERMDIKEAIGRVPIFENLLEEAFGTRDGAKLKALKESGALTMDTFLSGLSEAIQKNAALGNIEESLSVKFAKAAEVATEALAPIGNVILSVVAPAMNALVPSLNSVGKAFESMPFSVKAAAVGLGALGVALAAIAALFGSTAALITAAVAGAFVQLAVVIGAVLAPLYALKVAYDKNIGGLKDVTDEVFKFLETKWGEGMAAIAQFTNEQLAKINQFWQEHGDKLTQAADQIYKTLDQTVRVILLALETFWKAHGEDILSIATTAWNAIKAIVETSLDLILNTILLVTGIINRDWDTAWEAFKGIVVTVFNFLGTFVEWQVKVLIDILLGMVTWLANFGKMLMDAGMEAGRNLAQGLIDGVKSRIPDVKTAVWALGEAAKAALQQVLLIFSPSRVFFEYGQDTAQGFIDGIKSKMSEVTETVSMMGRQTPMGEGFGTGEGDSGGIAALGPPPELKDSWASFWHDFFSNIRRMRDEMQSTRDILQVSLIDGIMGIGDVFANAVSQWDGTLKGFWKSLVAGFRQMVQQILAEVIRLMIVKAIMNMIGAFAGGGGGLGGLAGGLAGHAGGIGAGIGHAGSFAAAGAGFAGGGGMTNNFSSNFNVTVNNPQNPKQVEQGMKQAVRNAIRLQQKEVNRFR